MGESTVINHNDFYNSYSKQPKHDKILIFDWDDTLCPTTEFFKTKGNANVPVSELQKLGKSLYELLKTYIKLFGEKNIFIVTNGNKGWVYESLQRLNKSLQCSQFNYFGVIHNLLISSNISVISANDLYSKQYPKQTELWKTLVFREITIKHFDLNKNNKNDKNINKYSIISIGDSSDEFIASFETKEMMKTEFSISSNILLHRIQLKYKPALSGILNQFDLLKNVAAMLNELSNKYTSLTIRYDKECNCYTSNLQR